MPKPTTPGRMIVRDKGQALVSAMQKALKDAPEAAQIVAAECVVDAETKDHQNWELIGALAKKLDAARCGTCSPKPTKRSRTKRTSTCTTRGAGAGSSGSTRSGLAAQLPPPEEEKDVKSAVEAAETEKKRKLQLVKKARGK